MVYSYRLDGSATKRMWNGSHRINLEIFTTQYRVQPCLTMTDGILLMEFPHKWAQIIKRYINSLLDRP